MLTSFSQNDNNCSINITAQSGVSVYMDNIFMGKTNKNGIILKNLKAGKHRFSFRKPLHKTKNRRLKLKPNKVRRYKLNQLIYNSELGYNTIIRPLITLPKDAVISDTCDVQPMFPGGENNLIRFLARKTKYPDLALQNGIQGEAVIQFIVDIDGSIKNIKPITDVDILLIDEAIRVVRTMPNWIPASLNGKPVRTECSIPVNFKLR